MQLDLTAIIAAVAGGILSIGAVAVFMGKYMPTVIKYATLAKDAIETLSDVAAALKDGKLTAEEIAEIQKDIADFKAQLKA